MIKVSIIIVQGNPLIKVGGFITQILSITSASNCTDLSVYFY